MHQLKRRIFVLLLLPCCLLSPSLARAQVDPFPRQLVQFGYSGSLEGHAPLAAYAFYLWNQPNFPSTNQTLRLAIAPTYIDSELGIRQIFGDNTDMGIGLAGGGFADSYYEINNGTYLPKESFDGFGVEPTLSLYHCFNPGKLIPLNGLVRGGFRYTTYADTENTAPTFKLPPDHGTFSVRTGLRWGGKEPMLYPSLAMELSAWYEGEFRTSSGPYGDTTVSPAGDRDLEPASHLFWGQALLAYTFPKSEQAFYLSVTAGTSVNADRLSCYRLGSLLPLVAEFPLALPGYYYQEISARNFVLVGGNYNVPFDKSHRWNFTSIATTAVVDYIPGLSQPGNWHSGVGGGILYSAPRLKVMAGYAYGFDAIRDGHRGAQTIGLLMQINLRRDKGGPVDAQPGLWRGFQNLFTAFTD